MPICCGKKSVFRLFTRPSFLNPNEKQSEKGKAVKILQTLDWTPQNKEKLEFYLLIMDYKALADMGNPRAIPPLLERLKNWPNEECVRTLKSLGVNNQDIRKALVEGVKNISGWHLLKPAWDLVLSLNDPQLAHDINNEWGSGHSNILR